MEVRKNRNGVNKMSLYIGTNYHPHDWPKERWEKDFQLMKEAGFDTVRLGHLCWDSYEPEDGVYTFEWFDQVMELCVKYWMCRCIRHRSGFINFARDAM